MKEFKITYFFDEEHYIRRFIFVESQEKAEVLVQSERDQYISFTDSRAIYHELHTGKVRVTQISEYHRIDKEKLHSVGGSSSPTRRSGSLTDR